MMPRIARNTVLVAAATLAAYLPARAQQPWLEIQMPTAAQVAAKWKAPPPEYGPEPYYGFGGVVDQTVIVRDLDRLKALGFQAITVQAQGRGTPQAYLSEDYFKLFQVLVAEAKKRDMRIWIVDDAGYPSGFAGGLFTQLKPDLRMQTLDLAQKLDVAGGASVSQAVTPATVAVTAVDSNGAVQQIPIANGAINWTAPPGAWTVLIVEHQYETSPTNSVTNPLRKKDQSQSLEDYMDPAATLQYIAFTHEQYKKYVGGEFGKTIVGFRGDEPDYTVKGLPWTAAFFDRFQQLKGYDVRPYVASFFLPKLTDEENRAKADYWNVFAIMFRDAYFKELGDWCAANGLAYQVHINHEELEMQLTHSEGSFFTAMQYVQVPGIDAIWHQIWMDTISDFPRLASSVSHVYGRARAFTESFAAYRPPPNIDQARYIINEQMVRGVNQIEMMYYPSSSEATVHPQGFMSDPGFPALAQYVRSLSYLMSNGRPDASVALYIPSSSMWLGEDASDRAFVSTERLLSEHQIDFDIVDDQQIATDLALVGGTFETKSGNRYRTVILPGESLLSQAALDRLKAFVAGGGQVLFLDHTPKMISGQTIRGARAATPADFSWAIVETSGQLSPTLEGGFQAPAAPPAPEVVPPAFMAALAKAVPAPSVMLDAPDTAVHVMTRRLADASVYLFFNESDHAVSHAVTLMTDGKKAEVWNPQTGAIVPLDSTRMKNSVKVDLSLKAYETEVIVVR